LQNEISRLFGSFFNLPLSASGPAASRRQWLPAMDLVETTDEYVLHADLPGLGSDDVKIEIDENVLTVSGERRSEQEHTGDGYRRIERASGAFSRSLRLPRGVDSARVSARFTDGVLEVHIPRPERRSPLSVPIESGATPAATSTENAQAIGEVPVAA
jgi:HSP20 family protein